MKLTMIMLTICLLAGAVPAMADEGQDEGRDKSLLGKVIDKTMEPFKGFMEPSTHLDPIVITPSRYEEPSLDASKNVTVIDAEKIKRSHVRYVPELLEKEAGMVVRDFVGNGKTVQLDMRGFGETSVSNVLVLIDGRRTNQIDISGTDWAQIDVDSIEKIEIVRGPQTVLYGDNAEGGVINIITKSGAGKKPEMGFGYRTGTYDYSAWTGHIDGGSDFLDYYGSTSYSNTDGYRTNNALETTDFNANLTIKPTDSFRLNFKGGYHKDWYGMPGALKPSDIDTVGWRGSITPNDRAKTDDEYFIAGPEVRYDLGFGDILFSGEVIARSRRTASLFFYSDGSNSEVNNHIRTFGATPKLAFTVDAFGMHNRMIAGLDYYGSKDEISNTNFSGGKDRIIIEKDTLGLYATDTVELLSRLILNAGYRAEWGNYKFDQQAVIAGTNRKSPFEYAVEAGATFKYNENSSIYASYSRSFRFPAVDEWYVSLYKDFFTNTTQGGLNLNLRPQTGNNYEIGIKENSSKYVSVKGDYFLMDTKHELYFDPITFTNSVYDRTIRHGLEVEAHAYLLKGIDAFADYTFMKAFYVGSHYAGNDIPMVPRHKFSAGLDYTFMDCLNIHYVANFVGLRRFINDQINLAPRLKSYLTHDIKASYYKYGLEVYGAIYNIFDEKYSQYGVTNSAGTRQAYYPSPGVNFLLGVNYKF